MAFGSCRPLGRSRLGLRDRPITRRIDLLLALEWESATPAGTVRHRDHLFAGSVDAERDGLPSALKEKLAIASVGQTVSIDVGIADLLGAASGGAIEIATSAFRGRYADGAPVALRRGRFYPASHFENTPGSQTGFLRCSGVNGEQLLLDSRHPLADYALTLSATVIGKLDEAPPAGATDWGAALSAGPGMQACANGQPTDFIDDSAYLRQDPAPDMAFYAPPRITAHLDRKAQQIVGKFYRDHLPAEGRVLDLMSSFHSNLLAEQRLECLVGLGLNGAELEANQRLAAAVVSDLNAGQSIPFGDDTFAAAICTVSIDYLTDPIRTLRDVGRVLRPGAPFAVTFSNRWFPPKVTRLWTELHPFEQIALVVQYFEQSGGFAEIETASFRGYPRPMDDPNYLYSTEADPIFAVVGYATGT